MVGGDVDLGIIFNLFKNYLSTDYYETAYFLKDKLIKGYYISSKEKGKIWYKWSFSLNKLIKKENFYNRWI